VKRAKKQIPHTRFAASNLKEMNNEGSHSEVSKYDWKRRTCMMIAREVKKEQERGLRIEVKGEMRKDE
jgi:outer membrane protease